VAVPDYTEKGTDCFSWKPELFFTDDGMSLDCRAEIPTWKNYRLKKR
jgi:hypothetical protein